MKYLLPLFIIEWVKLLREEGFKVFVKKRGWKVIWTIVIFYAIRDGILYILIPFLIYIGLF
ncbi:hypothetical protein E3V33_03015 [Candidatus Marinimicrobia bacterium MT.SAG.4]|nr:hypothetical protein E3V33_03015 [Candidatus Marinimicrobia bacterium MT.SAG.4]